MPLRAVVVEDDQDTRELIEIVLRRGGIDPVAAEDGESGLRLVADLQPDLVTLDVQLPDMEGTTVCRRLREFSDAAVMVITSRTDEVDRLLALEIGADDYLAKPFSPRELGARAAALLQRARPAAGEVGAPSASPPVADEVEAGGGLVLLPVRRAATLHGEPFPLTPTEIDVLTVLAREPGRAWDRGDLVRAVWGGDFIESDFLVDVHVANLRRKLRKAGAGSDRIRTVDGSGYLLTAG